MAIVTLIFAFAYTHALSNQNMQYKIQIFLNVKFVYLNKSTFA